VESGPDAETPRPIGVGLLLCMLERGGEPVVQVTALFCVIGLGFFSVLLVLASSFVCFRVAAVSVGPGQPRSVGSGTGGGAAA
jgi:hypothetical protein